MTKEMIDLKTPDGMCDCYVAYPNGGPFPAVLFYMDGIGLRPALKDMADRLSANGFYVLLPNMFYRHGRVPLFESTAILLPENRSKLMALVNSVTPERLIRDAGTFLEFLAGQNEVRPGSIGLTGYCMGGAMVLRTAAQYPDRVAAGASFHGGNLATIAPDSPHRLAGQIRAELYIGHADRDPSMPADQIEQLSAAFDSAGVRYRAELYEDALHGFTMSDLPEFNQDACERHWERLLTLLQTHDDETHFVRSN